MHRIILHHIPLTQPPIETSFYINLNFPRNFFEKRNTKRSSHISTYFREIETSSYSFYFSTENQVHAVVAFGSREFAGREEEGKKVARKFSHSESKGSSARLDSTRGRSDLSELCVIGQRIRRQHARDSVSRGNSTREKFRAPAASGHCINIRDVSSILVRVAVAVRRWRTPTFLKLKKTEWPLSRHCYQRWERRSTEWKGGAGIIGITSRRAR